MKKLLSKLFLTLSIFGVLCVAAPYVHADITPTLSVYGTGDGDSVTVNVSGDPNVSVIFYYLKSGAGQQIISLGTTNSSGTFSQTISSSQYGIISNSPVHVTTNGLNGISSSIVYWPVVTTNIVNNFTLNPTGLVLSVGQTGTVTANNSTGSLYLYNNSNSSIANINFSGSQITINAIAKGSTVATICTVGTTTNCPSIYITVQDSGAQVLSFSQSNLTLSSGQSFPVTISGGTGYYTVFNNSNASLVQTSINGQTINLSTSATYGSASITVCSTDMSSCGIINVTIGTSGTSYLTFSQTNPTISTGQNLSISIYGGSGSYTVSSNSNQNIVQASISGSTLNVYGISTGSSVVNVCASSGGCGQITVSVNYVSSGGTIGLSQTTMSLVANQTLSLTISGGLAPYSLPVASSNIFQASISGNIMTVTGLNSGSAQIAVCSAAGGCTWLSLIVNGNGTVGAIPTFSQNSVSLNSGQTTTITVYGNGSYYLSNTNSNIASATLNGNIVTISGINYGNTTISVCQNSGQCGTIYVSVSTNNQSGNTSTAFLSISQSNPTILAGQSTNVIVLGGSGNGYNVIYNSNSTVVSTSITPTVAGISNIPGSTLTVSGIRNGTAVLVVCDSLSNCAPVSVGVGVTQTPVVANNNSLGSTYKFTQYLTVGSTGIEVTQLQERLTQEGDYTGPITGTFGPLTKAAVEKYQSQHGLVVSGIVGSLTRGVLNAQ